MKRNIIAPSPADVDEASPAPLSWDEFAARGIEILDRARDLFLKLGDLAVWGWGQFGRDQSQRAWEFECAKAWGCNRSTVNKAINLARSPVALPRDKTPSWNYIAVSFGNGDPARTEEIIEFGIANGLSAFNLRLFCLLRDEGLTDDLILLRLYCSGNRLIVSDGEHEATVARFEDDGKLSRAGARLLGLKGGF